MNITSTSIHSGP